MLSPQKIKTIAVFPSFTQVAMIFSVLPHYFFWRCWLVFNRQPDKVEETSACTVSEPPTLLAFAWDNNWNLCLIYGLCWPKKHKIMLSVIVVCGKFLWVLTCWLVGWYGIKDRPSCTNVDTVNDLWEAYIHFSGTLYGLQQCNEWKFT